VADISRVKRSDLTQGFRLKVGIITAIAKVPVESAETRCSCFASEEKTEVAGQISCRQSITSRYRIAHSDTIEEYASGGDALGKL